MTWLRTMAAIAALAMIPLCSADDSARELLAKVAAAYRNLKSGRFESVNKFEFAGSGSITNTELHVQTQIDGPGRFRVETQGGGQDKLRISDGKTVWDVWPGANRYITSSYHEGRQTETPVAAYELLDQALVDQAADPRILRREPAGGVDCAVVEIPGKAGKTLWIDTATFLVRREVVRSETGARESTYTITYTVAVKDEPQFSSLFTYDPPPDMKIGPPIPGAGGRVPSSNLKGKPAPDFTLTDLDGNSVRLSDLRGKAVLLDFWATWCVPCRESMPVIELLHRNFQERGLVVLGIDDEDPKLARDYLRKNGYGFGSLIDSRKDVAGKYGVRGIPTTVLIDKDGNVVVYSVGSGGHGELRDALRKQGIWP